MNTKPTIHSIEIEGFGPVQIRSLTKAQIKKADRRAKQFAEEHPDFDTKGKDLLQAAQVTERIRLGLVSPRPANDDEVLATFADNPDALDAIGAEIIARGWPNA